MVTVVRVPSTRKRGFQPLSRRLTGASLEDALYEGVPPHMVHALRYWVQSALSEPTMIEVSLHLRLPFSSTSELATGIEADRLLDVVDAMLWVGLTDAMRRLRGPIPITMAHFNGAVRGVSLQDVLEGLSDILRDGGSAYQINGTWSGLERRVDPTVTAAMKKAIESADKSGRTDGADLLRDAWGRAYGLHPDPGEAYSDAVKAVEAVACPRFLPNDSEPTLGKVRSHLDQSRHLYEMVIADRQAAPASIDAVVELVTLLWHGQRERHAGGPSTAPISQDSAEAAVHLAATLVQWFSTGAVRKK